MVDLPETKNKFVPEAGGNLRSSLLVLNGLALSRFIDNHGSKASLCIRDGWIREFKVIFRLLIGSNIKKYKLDTI